MHLRTANRGRPAADGEVPGTGTEHPNRPMPSLGALLSVELPRAVTGPNVALLFVVASSEQGDITASPLVGRTPVLRRLVPCLVRYLAVPQEVTVEGFARTSRDGALVVQLGSVDERRRRRYQRQMPVTIEAPGADAITGTTEDISLGGLRARTPVALPAARRVFVSLDAPHSPAIIAAARAVSCERSSYGRWYDARLEYTSMTALDQARLGSLLDSPAQ